MRAPVAFAAALLASAPAAAAIESVSAPVPVTATSRIYGASVVPGAALSLDLAAHGYVEEEFFVRGTASAYAHDRSVVAKDVPYVTRIVIRRPRDPKRFSGFVNLEPIHPSQGGTSHWLATGDYQMRSGDIYVAASIGDDAPSRRISSTSPVPTAQSQVLKWFDRARYAPIDWPAEDGIGYEVMADIGRYLRGDARDNPLRGYRIRRMIVAGWSFTGSIQRTFINEGFHDRARLPDGRPVFDGYLIGISSRWNGGGFIPLNSREAPVANADPRRALKPIDVPVVEFLSEFEVATGPGAQLPDSDAKVGAHRLYEIGGTIHSASLVGANLPRTSRPNIQQLAAKGYPVDKVRGENASVACPLPTSDVPHPAVARAVFDDLKIWADGGTPAPHAAPLTIGADGKVVRDAAGNPAGGIRLAEFDAPLAGYGPDRTGTPGCAAQGGRPHFVRNDLPAADLKARYGTPAAYLRRYDAAVDGLVAGRWLLAADAATLKRDARTRAATLFSR